METKRETNHTPGAWGIQGKNIRHYWGGSKEYAHTSICDVSGQGVASLERANARLIAAAPELLAACEDLVNLWDEWVRYSEGLEEPLRRSIEMRVQQSRAAISKAKGE